jgi:ATP-dependent DNA ligase
MARRAELLDELADYREPAEHPWIDADSDEQQVGPTSATGQRRPGGVSRWTGGKNLAWEPLRPDLVVEVGYDAMEGDRFRHTAQFVRWRPDRDPRSCGYDQLDRPLRFDVDQVLGGDVRENGTVDGSGAS